MGISYTFINLSQMPNVTAARLLVGDANNRLAAVDVTGDVTIGNTGTTAIGASKVLGSMLPDDAVGYFATATEVEVDHADASPVQLLASDALNDRLIMVQAIASETATGGPDFDVGSQTTAPNAAFDDIGAGVWVAGERWTGFCLLPATEALRCTIADPGTAGKIKFRSVVLIPKVQTAQIANAAVTGVKLPDDAVGYADTATEVTVDHAAASPADLLVADASNDRLVMVQAIATETAAGDPEFDVGSQATDPNGAFDDLAAGAWAISERFVGYCLLPATEKLQCTINAAGTAGAIKFRTVVLIPKVQTAQVADDAVTSAKLDESTVQYAAVEISTAEVKTLNTAPKTLVAGQAGKILEFISLLLALDWNGVAYTIIGCANLNVNYVGGATVSTNEPAAFLTAVADALRTLDKLELTITPLVNAALVLTMGGADPAAGNSPIHAKVTYRVLATGL